MRAHFPRPKTASLSAWRTHSQHSVPGRRGVRAQGRIPGTSKVACSGQGEEAAGCGVQDGGRPHKGTDGTQGPSANRQRRWLRSEGTDPAAEGRGRRRWRPSAQGDARDGGHPWLRGRRQAQDKAQDKGTGPQGPVMAVPGQQTPHLEGTEVCQTLMQS